MEVRELLSKYDYPGDDTPIIRGSALGALNGEAQWEAKVDELMAAVDSYVPQPYTRGGAALPDADRGHLLDLWPRHCGHGSHRARQGEGGRAVRDRRLPRDAQDGLHRCRDVQEAARRGPRRRQRGPAAARHREGRCGARNGSGQAGFDYAAHRVKGEVYVPLEGGGGRHTPFFNGYRPQFYFRTTDVTGAPSCPPEPRW